ncbi:peptidoglycan-binding domain-containing protein [Streptomyces yaanensis]|uniref:Peptidoglycan-binding domain-containing protein n=1 Tax=Streptomyces yaanensis TaxID=1142239 RepID=A0ABV7SME6_9ACTN|nr:peptidoglycan-binding domain-containing protein [Streptomyces sp. CGMCC 4.7035]WNC00457.1 peptidoglycan-binding domain-containing protein [Streptomyces sp. CGMCC 4.7035]
MPERSSSPGTTSTHPSGSSRPRRWAVRSRAAARRCGPWPRPSLVQRLLNQQGAEPPLDDDGKYGPETETAVWAFQMAHGLTVTGTVTPETWVALAGPPPTPTPSGLPGSRSMRLTFSYDSADWAQGGPVVRFVSREDLEMTAPLAADPDDSPHGRAGF